MVKRLFRGIALCAFLLAPAFADTPTSTVIGTPPQPAWAQLTAEQRTILAPLGTEWDKMENFRRKKWLGIADRYSRMSPEEQHRVQARMREWAIMTPEQRAKVRDSYKEFQQLPPEKKQVVKEKWETYSKLPEEEKNRIKQNKATAKLPAPTESAPPAAEQPPTAPVTAAPPAAATAAATPAEASKP